MKLSTKIILPIILISALLILLNGCFGVPSPGYTPGTGAITGIIAAPCCSTSAEPVSETCCIAPEYWCFYCQQTWSLQDGIEVVLTYGEDEVAITTTNEDGEFTFTDVDPGKNYVVTAYCPDFNDNRPLVKDVALEVASTFDTGITDLVSTSLGLVVDFLVLYTEWGPEDISLDKVLADRPSFPKFPKFKKLVYEVRRVVENCEVNLLTDDDVQDALCRAAEEISKLEIGCGPGYTPPPPPPPDPCVGVPPPTANAGLDQSYEVCPGTTKDVGFTGSGSGKGTLSYSWDFDASDGITEDSAVQNPQYVPFGVGTYTVTLSVTDDCGSATDTMTVTITESETVSANAGEDQYYVICPPDTTEYVSFIGSGTGTGTLSYSWNFDDGNPTEDSIEQSPENVPFGVGVYNVVLTVKDECGTATDEMTLTIADCINTAPKVVGIPEEQAISAVSYQGSCIPTYRFTVSDYASDDDGDILAYSFVGDIPTGMTIDLDSGEIVWTPECIYFGSRCHVCGDVCVTVRVLDNGCCQPSYTDVKICVEVWYGPIYGGDYVGIGFDGCPIPKDACP